MITTTPTTKKPFEKERIEDLFISTGSYSDYAFRGILKEEEKEKEGGETYYLNDETREIAQEIFEKKELTLQP